MSIDFLPSLAPTADEHDVAAYFAPGYTAHLSEIDKIKHVGSFWTGIAPKRKMNEGVPKPVPKAMSSWPPCKNADVSAFLSGNCAEVEDCRTWGCVLVCVTTRGFEKSHGGPRFTAAIATCGEALDLALDGSPRPFAGRRYPKSRQSGSRAHPGFREAPTARMRRYARVVAALEGRRILRIPRPSPISAPSAASVRPWRTPPRTSSRKPNARAIGAHSRLKEPTGIWCGRPRKRRTSASTGSTSCTRAGPCRRAHAVPWRRPSRSARLMFRQ